MLGVRWCFFFVTRGIVRVIVEALSFLLLLNLLEVLATRSFCMGFSVSCKARFFVDGRGTVDRVKGFDDGW